MDLTKSQLSAIKTKKGHLQLIACAGSGKTEVVARRVVNLLKGLGVKPDNIIAFTFTEKAAGELKERIYERCKEEFDNITGLADMYVGTIHGYCLNLLQTEVPEYLKYDVLNEVQQNLLVNRNSKQSGLTTTLDLEGKKLRKFIDTGIYVKALSILREAQLDMEKLVGVSALNGLEQFNQLLRSKRYLDFSGIMEQAVAELNNDKELRDRLGRQIQHIIVDEYQDVNPIQESLVQIFADTGASICVVGDDDQTIYQWRGSNVQNIIDFERNYSGAKSVIPVRLEENFRSSSGIVELAREFIKQNDERLPKEMISTDAQPFEMGDIVAVKFESPEEEADYIVKTIKDLVGVAFKDGDKKRGLAYSDMSILLRSVRNNAEPIINALKEAGIPSVVAGMTNLFGAPEAEAARQLFYFIAGSIDKNKLRACWKNADLGIDLKKLNATIKELEKTVSAIDAGTEQRYHVYNIQRMFHNFIEDIKLTEENIPDDRGEIVFYNLGKFSQIISDFETIHYYSAPKDKYQNFASFLKFQAESTYPEGWQDNAYANPNAVRIMTIHQAKGMQWPVVFIPALLRNRFPSAGGGGRSEWHIIPAEGVKDQKRFKGTLEDERRLFYVAITRSQKFLFMTWAPIAGKNNRYARPSVFFEWVLRSKNVKRLPVSYSKRKRLPPEPKGNIASVVFSFSDLKYFFECPYQFKLRILYGFNPPIHEALGYGKSLHNALAEVHSKAIRGQGADQFDAQELVERHLHLPYAYPSLRETLGNSAIRVINDYLKDNESVFDKIEYSEKSVEISLGDGIVVNGRIDLVRRLDTNDVTIVDLKSSERSQEEDLTETQLHIYALGYQELTGRRPDFVEIYELEQRNRKPRSVDDDFIDLVKFKVTDAAGCLREGKFEKKTKKGKCDKCDFLKMCSAGCSITTS